MSVKGATRGTCLALDGCSVRDKITKPTGNQSPEVKKKISQVARPNGQSPGGKSQQKKEKSLARVGGVAAFAAPICFKKRTPLQIGIAA